MSHRADCSVQDSGKSEKLISVLAYVALSLLLARRAKGASLLPPTSLRDVARLFELPVSKLFDVELCWAVERIVSQQRLEEIGRSAPIFDFIRIQRLTEAFP